MHAAQAALLAALDADLRQHASFGIKRSGTPGDHATADWLVQRLADMGFAVQRDPVPVPGFTAHQVALACGEEQVMLLPQLPAVCTGAKGVHAPLAVVRHVWEADSARGCIAVVVLPHGRHAALWQEPCGMLLRAVTAAGARGIVLMPTTSHGEFTALNTPADAPYVPLPLAILAGRDLERVLQWAAQRRTTRMVLDGERSTGSTSNLVGRLQRGRRWLAFSTPRSGWFDSVGERGTGTAAWLALLNWARAEFPSFSLFAMNCGGHEFDFAGARQAMAFAPPPAYTPLWTHLGAALATRDIMQYRGRIRMLPSANSQRMLMVSPDLEAHARASFSGLAGLEEPWPVQRGAGELSTILEHGYRRGFAVLGIPPLFHTPADTLETASAELLLPVVQAHQRLITAALRTEEEPACS